MLVLDFMFSDDANVSNVCCIIYTNDLTHTRTVVRQCFKGDEASQWK